MEKNVFWEDEDVAEINKRIAGKNLKIVIPEGDDDRVIGALKYVDNIKFVLLGNKVVILEKITKMYKENCDDIMEKVEIIDQDDMVREDLLKIFVEKRHGKINEDLARELMKERNYFATLLLESGEVNGLVGGCVYSTADILKPAFQIIKPAHGNSTVSSVFVLKKGDEKLLFADCAVNIEPTKVQLKEIVRQTIGTAREMGIEPKVAMLSYSTKGSGNGHYIDLVRTAYEELIIETPEFKDLIDGELQFDAAYVPKVGNQKAPGSPVAGRANVFVFPHLNSGNIAYKMAQYLGGYEAVGPLLQGLNRPVNDLSRGSDAATIAKVAYLALRKY